jgi:hypothetical protein
MSDTMLVTGTEATVAVEQAFEAAAAQPVEVNVTEATTEATVVVEAAPVVEKKSTGPRGRPKFSESQKAFRASIWVDLVYGQGKIAARKELKALREQYKNDVEKLAVLNSASRSIEMRGRKHAPKVVVTETAAPVVEVAQATEQQPVVIEIHKVEAAPTVAEVAAQKEQTVEEIIKQLDQQMSA